MTLTQNPKSKPDPNNLVFGKYFSDHMLTINWTSEKGWEKPRIIPFENLSLAPATSCLHYATEVNENMMNGWTNGVMNEWIDGQMELLDGKIDHVFPSLVV